MRSRSRWITIMAACGGLAMAAAPALAATTTVRWGPITIPGATSSGPGEVDGISGTTGIASFVAGLLGAEVDIGPLAKPCTNCFITGITPNLVDAQGNTVNFNNGGMLHHVVVANIDEPDIFCPPGFGGLISLMGLVAGGNQRFFAAGNERTIFHEVPGDGYRVDSGDDWVIIYHVMNMTPNARDVYFEMTFDHVSSGVADIRPMWLDFDQCDDSERANPAGYSDSHWGWKADRSGYVKTIGGHIHDFGLSIAWQNTSRNQNVYTSVAGYAAGSARAPVGPGSGADTAHPASYNTVTSDPLGLGNYMGHIADMTVGHPNSRIKKRDNLRLHTQYYHTSAAGEGDADMGIMMASMDEDFCITDLWCF